MEKKRVMCPYDGVPYYRIPRTELSKGANECPYCGAKKVVDGSWPHQPVERVVLSDDEAISIFMKYAKKHYGRSWNAGGDIFSDAWDSQWWGTKEYDKKRASWVGDDLAAAFEWWLDAHGRYESERKGTKSKAWLNKLENTIDEYVRGVRQKKYEQQRKSRERSEERKQKRGEEVVKTLRPGDVALVEFKNDFYWPTRGMLVMEVEDHFVGGFYLDRVMEKVPAGSPEREGYQYSKVNKYSNTRYEWDGKTFKKTRTYETKMTKFVREKVEGAVVEKPD